MRHKKVYGQSQNTICAFCSKQAVTQTEEKIPCCKDHIHKSIGIITCLCGNILDIKHSKYGPFFTCVKCGVISFSKGMSMKDENLGTGFKLNKKYRRQSVEKTNSLKSEKTTKDLWKEYYGV